jgi:hypothetical protein
MGLLRKISSAINPGGKTLGEINKLLEVSKLIFLRSLK